MAAATAGMCITQQVGAGGMIGAAASNYGDGIKTSRFINGCGGVAAETAYPVLAPPNYFFPMASQGHCSTPRTSPHRYSPYSSSSQRHSHQHDLNH